MQQSHGENHSSTWIPTQCFLDMEISSCLSSPTTVPRRSVFNINIYYVEGSYLEHNVSTSQAQTSRVRFENTNPSLVGVNHVNLNLNLNLSICPTLNSNVSMIKEHRILKEERLQWGQIWPAVIKQWNSVIFLENIWFELVKLNISFL